MTRFLQVGGSYVVGPSGGAFAVEPPTVALSLTSGDLYEGNAAIFHATLSKPWIVDVDVTYATSNGTASAGTDYTSASGTATITAGDTFVAIPVTTTLRSGVQASRTFTLTLSAAVDADNETLTITNDDVTVTILDTEVAPDAPTLSVAAVAVADEGTPLTFRVTAAYPFEEDITFSYATGNGTGSAGADYTSASGTGTITAESLSTDIAVTTALREGFQGPRTFTLTISNAETASEVPVTIATGTATGTIAETEVLAGEHGYFDTLIARPDYWRGLSMRPIAGRPKFYASGGFAGLPDPYYEHQLKSPADGGYANSNALPLNVTYSPGTDTDPNAQDLAKVVIEPWAFNTVPLYADMAIDDEVIVFDAGGLSNGKSYDNNLAFKFPNGEIIVLTSKKDKTAPSATCARAQFGTTATAHTAGEVMQRSGNGLANQVRIRLDTVAGDRTLTTWDMVFTDSYLRKPEIGEGILTDWLKNHKSVQFTSKSNGAGDIWEEMATRFAPSGNAPSPAAGYDNTIHVAEADWRSYMALTSDTVFNPLLPNRHPVSVTREYPTRPMLNTFIIHPNRRTRWWVYFEQRIDDYDLMSVWVADEVQEPVQLFDELPVKAWQPGSPNGSIREWWLEMDTSDSNMVRRDQRNLVAYAGNMVTLKGLAPADVPALLVKPE